MESTREQGQERVAKGNEMTSQGWTRCYCFVLPHYLKCSWLWTITFPSF